jgi:hypothetical protein
MDKWDDKAAELLPCDCGEYLHQGLGYHRGSCATKFRPAVSAELRMMGAEITRLNAIEDRLGLAVITLDTRRDGD